MYIHVHVHSYTPNQTTNQPKQWTGRRNNRLIAPRIRAFGFDRTSSGVLHLLGPRPPPSKPGALAFWLAALLNPLPPLGVAPELRPRVLLSPSPDERLAVVYAGLAKSIALLEGKARGGG